MASRSHASRLPTFRVPIAVLLGAIACWLTLCATNPPGPGVDPDSMQYVAAARSLATHGTLEVPDASWDTPDSVEPLSHFPPGVSVVLAIPTALGADPLQATRAVNGLAAMALVIVVFLLMSGPDGGSRWAGTIAAIAIGVTPGVAYVFMDVLSEPLFLLLLAVMLALMVRDRDRRPWVAGLVAAAATMVRYAGVALICAVAAWYFLAPGDARRRIRRAASGALPGVLALGAWTIRTHIVTEGEGIRQFSVYRQIGPTLHEGVRTLVTWAAPLLSGVWAAAVAVIVLAGLVLLGRDAVRRWMPQGDAPARAPAGRLAAVSMASTLTAGCYIGVVVAARLFADPAIPLDDRILAPFVFLIAIAAVSAAAVGWRTWLAPARVAAAVLLGGWCIASGWATAQDGIYAVETGNDYSDFIWSGSPLVAWARDHAQGRPLFTNYPTALYFHAGRWSKTMPLAAARDTARAFGDTVVARHGLIVAFDRSTEFVTSPRALLQILDRPVRALLRTHDGAIYEVLR